MKISVPLATAILLFSGHHLLYSEPPPTSPESCATVLAPVAGETPAAASSSLVWIKPKVELNAKLGQKVIRASYHFTNTSKNPVAFIDLVPSCGCVATQIDKLEYAPDESGEVKVTLDMEMDDDLALQDRSIVVTTSDAPKNPTTLKLLVHVPTAVEASTKAVSWKIGEKPVTREVLVSAGPGIEDMKLSKEYENGDFAVEIKPDASGRNYHVSITPTNTSAQYYAQILLDAESASFPRTITCQIQAHVK